jgi:hypothetical protein
MAGPVRPTNPVDGEVVIVVAARRAVLDHLKQQQTNRWLRHDNQLATLGNKKQVAQW